jgi:hypothetical protein
MQGKQEIFTECWWGYLLENGHWEDKEEIKRMTLRRILWK